MFSSFNKLKIRSKLLLVTFGTMFTILPFIFIYLYVQINKIYYESVTETVTNNVENTANEISTETNTQAAVIRTLANSFAGDVANRQNRDGLRESFNGMIESAMNTNPDIFGIWCHWEQNALDSLDGLYAGTDGHDSTGRFIPYWLRESGYLKFQSLPRIYDNRDFYLKVKQTKSEVVVEPYLFSTEGKEMLFVTIVCPIIVKDEFVGAIGVDFPLNNIQKIIEQKEILGTNMAAIYTENENIVAHYDAKNNGKSVRGTIKMFSDAQVTQISDGIKANQNFKLTVGGTDGDDEIEVFCAPFEVARTKTNWGVIQEVPTKIMGEKIAELILKILVLALIALAVMSTLIYLNANSISKSLSGLVGFLNLLTEGDLTLDVPENVLQVGDETGEMARATQKMQEQMRLVIAKIIQSADNIAIASAQLQSGNQSVAQGANEQAANVEEVSSTMEEIVANIQQNTENAKRTDILAGDVNKNITVANDTSAESLESIKKIADKIKIVNNIAFQTNILALNAAVEAARAGERGKGFAVVAAEVRKLAEHSKKAADEIMALAAKTVNVTEQSAKMLNDMIPNINKVSVLVQEIASASSEQSSGSNQVNTAIQQLNSVAQQNASASEAMASSADMLANQAKELKNIVAFYKLNDD